ncbi:MAG: TonB-dependent receptor [Bacteroidetes bacterium]|nr:TonB-dependent receptor [Bacteroidota bacterium]
MNADIFQKIFYGILFTALSVSAVAQTFHSDISGFVSDSTSGEMIIGANILLYKEALETGKPPLRGVSTNNFGFFIFPKLPPGMYVVVVRNIGYAAVVKSVRISSDNEHIQLTVKLPAENINLQEVFIEGNRLGEPLTSSLDINPELIKMLPSMGAKTDLFKVLQSLPGIKTASEISGGLYVRGGSPDQNLTLVDGVMMYNPTHLGNFSGVFNTDAVKNIRLIKGAFPAEYGGRLSSVLDIMLRPGTKEKEKGTVSLGLINSGMVIEGPLNDHATYMVSGEKMYYDVLENSVIKSSVIPRYNYYNLSTKITLTPSASNVYSLSGLYGKDNLYNPAAAQEKEYFIGWKNAFASFSWQHINPQSSIITASLSYIDYESESLLEDRLSSRSANNYYALSKLKDVTAKLKTELYWNEFNTLKIGSEMMVHNYSLIYSNFYHPLLKQTYETLPDILALETALYAQNESRFTGWLKTNIGVRGYYFKSKKYFSLEPRLSAEISADENLSFTAAYAVAHQFLHLIIRNDISLPTDLWYPSSENIEPSRSQQYVLGIHYNLPDDHYLFSLEGYYKNMSNLYEFKNSAPYALGDPIENLFTKGDGEAYGIEWFMYKTAGKITGWVGYTLSWTRQKFSALNAGKIFYPRYDRRNDVAVTLAYEFNKNWNAGISWVYASGQGFTVPNGQYLFEPVDVNSSRSLQYNYTERNSFKLPAYHKLDVTVSYKFAAYALNCETYISLYNVYNRKNPFAIYSTNNLDEVKNNSSASLTTRLKEISLFPFIPSAGIKITF